MFYAYVIKSEKNGMLYKGSTDDLERRINQHNKGKVKSTKGSRPWTLVHVEKFGTREDAYAREKQLKTGTGREFLKSIGL